MIINKNFQKHFAVDLKRLDLKKTMDMNHTRERDSSNQLDLQTLSFLDNDKRQGNQ